MQGSNILSNENASKQKYLKRLVDLYAYKNLGFSIVSMLVHVTAVHKLA